MQLNHLLFVNICSKLTFNRIGVKTMRIIKYFFLLHIGACFCLITMDYTSEVFSFKVMNNSVFIVFNSIQFQRFVRCLLDGTSTVCYVDTVRDCMQSTTYPHYLLLQESRYPDVYSPSGSGIKTCTAVWLHCGIRISCQEELDPPERLITLQLKGKCDSLVLPEEVSFYTDLNYGVMNSEIVKVNYSIVNHTLPTKIVYNATPKLTTFGSAQVKPELYKNSTVPTSISSTSRTTLKTSSKFLAILSTSRTTHKTSSKFSAIRPTSRTSSKIPAISSTSRTTHKTSSKIPPTGSTSRTTHKTSLKIPSISSTSRTTHKTSSKIPSISSTSRTTEAQKTTSRFTFTSSAPVISSMDSTVNYSSLLTESWFASSRTVIHESQTHTINSSSNALTENENIDTVPVAIGTIFGVLVLIALTATAIILVKKRNNFSLRRLTKTMRKSKRFEISNPPDVLKETFCTDLADGDYSSIEEGHVNVSIYDVIINENFTMSTCTKELQDCGSQVETKLDENQYSLIDTVEPTERCQVGSAIEDNSKPHYFILENISEDKIPDKRFACQDLVKDCDNYQNVSKSKSLDLDFGAYKHSSRSEVPVSDCGNYNNISKSQSHNLICGYFDESSKIKSQDSDCDNGDKKYANSGQISNERSKDKTFFQQNEGNMYSKLGQNVPKITDPYNKLVI